MTFTSLEFIVPKLDLQELLELATYIIPYLNHQRSSVREAALKLISLILIHSDASWQVETNVTSLTSMVFIYLKIFQIGFFSIKSQKLNLKHKQQEQFETIASNEIDNLIGSDSEVLTNIDELNFYLTDNQCHDLDQRPPFKKSQLERAFSAEESQDTN